MIVLTKKLLNSARIRTGGYQEEQVRLAKKINPCANPVQTLEGKSVPIEWWVDFLNAKQKPSRDDQIARLRREQYYASDVEYCPCCGHRKEEIKPRIEGAIKLKDTRHDLV